MVPAFPAGDVTASAVPTGERVSGDGRLVALIFAGYPVAWALGFGPGVFAMAAFAMALWLGRNRPLLVPPGTVLLTLFLLLVAASVVNVDSAGRVGVWVLRASWYGAAFVTWLYLARQISPRARRLIVYSLVVAWAMAVLGGWAALLVPDLSWRTPVSAVLPDVIANDEFIRDLLEPRLAEVQTFYPDIRLNRPAAPYAYTNAWGSTVALLTPFVFATMQERHLRLPRWLGFVALAVAAVPFAFALNRGAWLTLGLGTLYGVVRGAIVNRRFAPILALAFLVTVGAVAAASTGLVDTTTERLDTRTADSNDTRANLYLETLDHSADSPLIGFGTPRPNPSNPTGPPLGTHGQLWAVMFAHGYVAAGLYVAFFGIAFLRARGRHPLANWSKVVLFMGLVQLPIYGHLPAQLFVLIAAAAIATWPPDALGDDVERSRVTRHARGHAQGGRGNANVDATVDVATDTTAPTEATGTRR